MSERYDALLRDLDALAALADVRGEPPTLDGWRARLSGPFYVPHLLPAIERQSEINRLLVVQAARTMHLFFLAPITSHAHPSAPLVEGAARNAHGRALASAAALAGPLPDAGPALGALHGALHAAAVRVAGDAGGETAWLALSNLARRAEERFQMVTERAAATAPLARVTGNLLPEEIPLAGATGTRRASAAVARLVTAELWEGMIRRSLARQAAFNRAAAAWLRAPSREALAALRALPSLTERRRWTPLRAARRALLQPLQGYVEGVIERQARFNEALVALLARLDAAREARRGEDETPLADEAAALAAALEGGPLGEVAARIAARLREALP